MRNDGAGERYFLSCSTGMSAHIARIFPLMFASRYERELNRGVRPPLRLIVAQDVPASCPMVLCVSDVIWPQETTLAPPGQPVIPEIEVTDGWYRLRAQIDLPLARAVQKGALRAGRKIAVAKAQA